MKKLLIFLAGFVLCASFVFSQSYTYVDATKVEGAETGTLYCSLDSECIFFLGDSIRDYGRGSEGESYWTLPDGRDGYEILEAAAGDSQYFLVTPEVLYVFKVAAENFGDTNPMAFLEFCFVCIKQARYI